MSVTLEDIFISLISNHKYFLLITILQLKFGLNLCGLAFFKGHFKLASANPNEAKSRIFKKEIHEGPNFSKISMILLIFL
jgi:hypothetical protein